VEDDVVLLEPRLDALLEPRTLVSELGQLDQVLELEVVDVVDQATPDITVRSGAGGSARPLREPARMPGAGFEPALDRF
jgi:hypothetical protein